jgi:serine/threonine protein kinase
MGEVFEVEHELLGTRRALKVLAKQFTNRQDLTERLRVEARALARLSHPNLVEVYDLGTAKDGRVFFAMELLAGATLRQMLRGRGPMSVQLAVRLMGQVLDGLYAAHCAGLLHRDVKPENVFVCRNGTVKLLDFGVAKAIDASTTDVQLTGAGMTVGTPRYMAPEQAEGRQVDARADVYAAGLVLWELLVGRPAFEENDIHSLAMAKMTSGVRPLARSMLAPISRRLSDAVDLACDKEPLNRFPCAQAFATEIRAALAEEMGGGAWAAPVSKRDLIAMDVTIPQIDPIPSSTEHSSFGQGVVTEVQTGPGPGGTAPNLDFVMADLTERIEAVEPIDRDAPTRFPVRESAQAYGPSGTQILPSSAGHRRDMPIASQPPPARESPSQMPGSTPVSSVPRPAFHSSERPTIQLRSAKESTATSQARLLSLVILAFFVPVIGALIIGFMLFRRPMQTAPTIFATEPMLVKSAPLPAAATADPIASATSSAIDKPLVSPISSSPAKSSLKPPKAAPIRKSKPSMPSSGL